MCGFSFIRPNRQPFPVAGLGAVKSYAQIGLQTLAE